MPEMQYNFLNPFYFTSVFLPPQQRNGGIFYGTDWPGKLQPGDHCVSLVQSAPMHVFSFAVNNCICGCLHCLITSGLCKFPTYPSSFFFLHPSPCTQEHTHAYPYISGCRVFRPLNCCRYTIYFLLFILPFSLIFTPGSIFEARTMFSGR